MNFDKLNKITAGKVKTSGISAFSELELSKVYPNPNQPRKQFDDIVDLALTIQEHGLLQPITVVKKDDGYMIVSGERRYKAHIYNDAKTIKAHIIQADIHQVQEMALIENIQRNDLTDFEKAKYIGELWASGKYESKSQLAKKIGKSASYISKAFGCLRLDETILEDLENNISKVPLSVLEEISRVKDKDTQIEVYEKYVLGEITRDDIKNFKPAKKDKRYDDEVFEAIENFPRENKKSFTCYGFGTTNTFGTYISINKGVLEGTIHIEEGKELIITSSNHNYRITIEEI